MKSRILLSAYACEPNKGSEPGIGWHWAVELARMGHEVWVLTRENNRPAIEAELDKMETMPNLNFLYYDLPAWMKWWKKLGKNAKRKAGGRLVHLYYFLWQWGAYRLARRVHATERFDSVHHVTFVSVRQPSFMGSLGIPFIFGPVAGGERAPWRLRSGYGLRGFVRDALRDVLNFLIRVDPFMRRTFRQAERIYVTSEQTRGLVPHSFRNKTRVHLAIGWQGTVEVSERKAQERKPLRILYVGQFLYLKGMHLGLPAFARLLKAVPDARLTLVGKGPDETRWRRLADTLGISEHIEWVQWVDRNELPALYGAHDVFLFPSLHDSGGMVVLEAMAHGLPVVCFDLGGPGVMVNNSCGRVVATKGKSEADVIKELGEALIELISNSSAWSQIHNSALNRTKYYLWNNLVRQIYGDVEK